MAARKVRRLPPKPAEPGVPAPGDAWAKPSRSQLKRDAEAVRLLGERLTNLTPSQRSSLPLDQEVLEAIDECRGLKRNARLRQLRALGKLLRTHDLQPLREALGDVNGVLPAAEAENQLADAWRKRLLEQGDTALAQLMDAHPDADGQRIRQLVRRALSQKDPENSTAKRARLELLRALRGL